MAKNVIINYGSDHTKKYVKSVVADFLVEKSDNSENPEYKIISDVNLILRQKTLHRNVGIENLRDYIDKLQYNQSEQHNFTDDELFSMIEPKAINNLTTMYEYARYIQDNSKSIKSKFDELVKAKKQYYQSSKSE